MPTNETEWDAHYRASAERKLTSVSGCVLPLGESIDIVSEWLPLSPRGAALDIACGAGRYSLLLAAQGRSVTAIDSSGEALKILETRAQSLKLPATRSDTISAEGRHDRGIQLVQANLEEIRLPDSAYALILCIRYLQRSLFPQMARALEPGGLLLFETFTRAQLNYDGGPRNPAHLLEPGELRSAFPELRVLFYRELNAGQGIASLVARKPERSGR